MSGEQLENASAPGEFVNEPAVPAEGASLSFDRACLQASGVWKVCGSPEWVVGGRETVRVEVFHDLHSTL